MAMAAKEGSSRHEGLLRAGSWQVRHGVACRRAWRACKRAWLPAWPVVGPQPGLLLQAQGEAVLLKTASDIMLQMAMSGVSRTRHMSIAVAISLRSLSALCRPLTPRLWLQGLKQHHLAAEDGGEGGKTNSVDSSSTAAGQRPHALLLDSATAGMLPPLRQISLDVIAASELNRAKGGVSGSGERQSIFQDVFEQVGDCSAHACEQHNALPAPLALCCFLCRTAGRLLLSHRLVARRCLPSRSLPGRMTCRPCRVGSCTRCLPCSF